MDAFLSILFKYAASPPGWGSRNVERLKGISIFTLHPPTPTSLLPGYNSVVIPAPAFQAVPWGDVANYMHLWREVKDGYQARRGSDSPGQRSWYSSTLTGIFGQREGE